MLADKVVIVGTSVFVGAGVAEGAEAFAECFAYWTVVVKTESVFFLQEVGEGEVVSRWCSIAVGYLMV